MKLCQMRTDGRFELTQMGQERHQVEVLNMADTAGTVRRRRRD